MILIANLSHGASPIYEIFLKDLNGDLIDLNKFKGKNILFVNVASKCGFTRQYSDLEKLFQRYNDDLVIVGLPCNQFGGQEPGTAKEIQNFCSKNYGVTFILSEKIDVRGENIHPIYKWLTNKDLNGKFSSSVKWNFQKYFVNREGKLLNYFYSTTSPLSSKITSLIR